MATGGPGDDKVLEELKKLNKAQRAGEVGVLEELEMPLMTLETSYIPPVVQEALKSSPRRGDS